MIFSDRKIERFLLAANIHNVRTPWIKAAACRQLTNWRNRSLYRIQFSAPLSFESWNRLQQSNRVWMARMAENFFHGPFLYDRPRIHHGHPICHLRRNPHIMGDEQN